MNNRKPEEAPERMWIDEYVGSNGIHCLDYQNFEEDTEYIRADKYAELKKKVEIAKDVMEYVLGGGADPDESERLMRLFVSNSTYVPSTNSKENQNEC